MSKPVRFQEWPESLGVAYGPYRAVTERVVDGDTVHVMVSLGVDEYAYIQDDPYRRRERSRGFLRPAGVERRGQSRQGLSYATPPAGTRCRLVTQRDTTTFGRYVGGIELVDGRDVATVLVEAGHATPVEAS